MLRLYNPWGGSTGGDPVLILHTDVEFTNVFKQIIGFSLNLWTVLIQSGERHFLLLV